MPLQPVTLLVDIPEPSGSGVGAVAAANIAGIKALDPATTKTVELYDRLLSGHFDRVDEDLSGRLVTKIVTSTSVSGNTFTSTAHELDSGQVVVPTTSANGLTAGTKYWVIRNGANGFNLATSYANMRAGTSIVLSGAVNLTFKRLLDPLEGMFVIADGQSVTGEDGAWCRRWNFTDVYPQWFGAQLDGTDDREALLAALEVAAEYHDYADYRPGLICQLPGCEIGFDGEILNYRNASLMGAGRSKTVLKNLSATANGITFDHGATPGTVAYGRAATSFGRIGGFTINQNESTGRGLYIGGQYSVADDIMVRNQGGIAYAVTLEKCTLTGLHSLDILQSTFGLRMIDVLYANLGDVSIEAKAGYALHASNCTALSFRSLYVDPWDQNTRAGSIYMVNCPSTNILSLTAELPAAAAIDALGWFHFDNCEGLRIFGGRISHSATQQSKVIFLLEGGANVHISGIEWIEATPNIAFLRSSGSATNGLRVSNIMTRHAGNAGRDGVYLGAMACHDVIIENWMDQTGTCTHTISGNRVAVLNTASNITLTSGTVHTLINCRGTNGGAVIGAAVKLNSA